MSKRKLLSVCALCITFLSFTSGYFQTDADTKLTFVSDQLTRINENTTSAHNIYFVTPSGLSAGQSITVTFPSSSFIFGSLYDYTDMTLSEGSTNNCSTATFTNKTLGSTASGTTWGATYSTNVVTFTSGTDTVTADRCVRIILSANGGNHNLTNPSVTSNTVYNINISVGTTQSAELAVIILDDPSTPDGDQIRLDTNITPAISLDIDVANTGCNNSTETTYPNNIVALGTLVAGSVVKSSTTVNFICIDAATNSSSGMQVYAQSSRSNTIGGLVSGSNVITAKTANLNSGAVDEGYGLRIASTGTPEIGSFTATSPFNSATSGDVGVFGGALGSASQIVSSAGASKTGTSSRIAVEVAAKASSGTPSGNYSDTITITAVANF